MRDVLIRSQANHLCSWAAVSSSRSATRSRRHERSSEKTACCIYRVLRRPRGSGLVVRIRFSRERGWSRRKGRKVSSLVFEETRTSSRNASGTTTTTTTTAPLQAETGGLIFCLVRSTMEAGRRVVAIQCREGTLRRLFSKPRATASSRFHG